MVWEWKCDNGVINTLLDIYDAVFARKFLSTWGWPLLVSATDLIIARGLTRQI